MKKILSLLSLIFAGTLLFAGPADPSLHIYTQPDGSVVRYYMHGDEYLHWMTDDNGAVIRIGEDGYVHPAQKPSEKEFEMATRARSATFGPRMAESQGLTGNKKFCVILVEFADVKFQKTQADYDKFFNGKGSESGSTDSVKEYWTDQSDGKFIPTFDVFGPYTMEEGISYYVEKSKAKDLLKNAIQQGDDEIDFSQYKHKDSGVESVIMVFAGYSAAMGAVNSLWPHQGWLSHYTDGVNINSYCCVPELQGTSGTTIAGIGHVCHEFGHCLGLPDVYDTQRSDHESTAKAPTYYYSVMDHGNYTNNSKTPPPLSIIEKYLCGWVSDLTSGDNGEIETLTSSKAIDLKEIGQRSNPRALRIDTEKDGEFFWCEFRSINSSVNKWGAGLPKGGMIVYHVDRSSGHWDDDDDVSMNTDPTHPNFYLVNASDPDSIPLYNNRTSTDWASFPFPGNSNVRSFNPHSWSGMDTNVSLTGMPTIGASSGNTKISIQAHVRNFPLINNPKKGVYSNGDKFYLKLSKGRGDSSSVSTWKFDNEVTTDSYKTLTSGAHTVEAVLNDSRILRLDITVK